MEKFPKFIKKVSQIAAISSIGLIPGQLKGQEIVNNAEHQINIENNEQLKFQIFTEVEVAFDNGVLKNTPDNVYFFRLEKDNYDITYNFDNNSDNEKDNIPTIEIDYTDGNSNYILQKGPNEINNRDIVYNYKDNILSNSETKTYGDFAGENMMIISELYGKNDSPVYFRKINKEEMSKFLEDIKKFAEVIDKNGVSENNKNIKQKEEEIKIEKQKEEEKEKLISPVSDIFKILNQKKEDFGANYDKSIETYNLVKGEYTYAFDKLSYLKISFMDINGYKNILSFNFNNGKPEIRQSIKVKKAESGIDKIEMTDKEISLIYDNILLELQK